MMPSVDGFLMDLKAKQFRGVKDGPPNTGERSPLKLGTSAHSNATAGCAYCIATRAGSFLDIS